MVGPEKEHTKGSEKNASFRSLSRPRELRRSKEKGAGKIRISQKKENAVKTKPRSWRKKNGQNQWAAGFGEKEGWPCQRFPPLRCQGKNGRKIGARPNPGVPKREEMGKGCLANRLPIEKKKRFHAGAGKPKNLHKTSRLTV